MCVCVVLEGVFTVRECVCVCIYVCVFVRESVCVEGGLPYFPVLSNGERQHSCQAYTLITDLPCVCMPVCVLKILHCVCVLKILQCVSVCVKDTPECVCVCVLSCLWAWLLMRNRTG